MLLQPLPAQTMDAEFLPREEPSLLPLAVFLLTSLLLHVVGVQLLDLLALNKQRVTAKDRILDIQLAKPAEQPVTPIPNTKVAEQPAASLLEESQAIPSSTDTDTDKISTPIPAEAKPAQDNTRKESSTVTDSKPHNLSLPPVNSQPLPSMSDGYQSRSGATIFDPELRQKLQQAQENKATLGTDADNTVYHNTSGNEVYINGDNCQQIQAASDDHDVELWQIGKRCAWIKSDSEKAIDNVNRAMRERFGQ